MPLPMTSLIDRPNNCQRLTARTIVGSPGGVGVGAGAATPDGFGAFKDIPCSGCRGRLHDRRPSVHAPAHNENGPPESRRPVSRGHAPPRRGTPSEVEADLHLGQVDLAVVDLEPA